MEPAKNEFEWIVEAAESSGEYPTLDTFDQWSLDDFADILNDEVL